MTAMFVREVRGNQRKRNSIITFSSWLKFIFTMSHEKIERNRNKGKWENPPTNISATVRLITRYMARVRRLRFFIKRMIDRRFTVTIATHTVRDTANQVMHSDDETRNMTCVLLRLFASHFYQFSSVVHLPLERIEFELNKVSNWLIRKEK